MDPETGNQVAILLGLKSYLSFIKLWPEWWFDPLEKRVRLDWRRITGLRWPRSEREVKGTDCWLFRRMAERPVLVLQWLHREYPHTAEEAKSMQCQALGRAAWCGRLDVVKWLHREFPHTQEEVEVLNFTNLKGPLHRSTADAMKWLNNTFSGLNFTEQ